MARLGKKQLDAIKIIAKARRQPTLSIPEAGFLIAEQGETASYDAARKNRLGVPVLESGGKLRCRSVDVLSLLGLGTEEPLQQSVVVPTNAAAVNAAELPPAERPGFRKARKLSNPAPSLEPAPPAPDERIARAILQQLRAQLAPGDFEQLLQTHLAASQPGPALSK
jgi:hypothetical protein